MSSNLYKLINNRQLADIGPVLDDGGSVYFPHGIEWLALITQQARYLEKLSAYVSRGVLPGLQRVEDER